MDYELDQLGRRAARVFFYNLKRSLQKHRSTTVGLCGGTSVQEFYKKIPTLSELTKEEWSRVHFFLTDERITTEYEETNYKIILETFLDKLIRTKIISPENVHPFPYGSKSYEIQSALEKYTKELTEIATEPVLDMIVLSTGEDGHIASIFPNNKSCFNEDPKYIHIKNSPKKPEDRISASPSLIEKSSTALLFFTEDEKRNAYHSFLSNSKISQECPAKLVEKCQNLNIFTNLQSETKAL